jgi:uncharacterized protein YcsI (UPF0317 family)
MPFRGNPNPCPMLDVTQRGSWEPRQVAPGSDVCTDVPRYRVYRQGVLVEEVADVTHLWREDFIAFLLGCSFSFEAAMQRAGIPLRHLEEGSTYPCIERICRAHVWGYFQDRWSCQCGR